MKIKLAIGLCLSASLLFNSSFAQEATPSTEKAAPAVAPGEVLETAIDNYMKAWKEEDFATMRGYENWEGGPELGEVKYIQSFDAHFRVHNWKITKTLDIGNDEYKVWLLMDHNLPKQIAGFLPPDQTVRSTRFQWWKKQGDKFVHLFHIERQRLMELIVPK
ncbi:hypothetical protein PN36_06420 [Candidatus Thiomargarita nelsonii]|uniref:Secreted protein n=1 Tax=Candidatus Thiomargarita nelsonii TaxID=1003181 RepID=A0A4E0RTQ2_9GAMM|nr:hypothetical protein PN36_06420 [Candidatus Thiomargarita nelsonii]